MTEEAVYDCTRRGVRYFVLSSSCAAIDAHTRVATVRVVPQSRAAKSRDRAVLVRVVKGRATASGGLPQPIIDEVAALLSKAKGPALGPRVSFPLWTLTRALANTWIRRHDPKRRAMRRQQLRELVDAIRVLRTHAVP